MISALRPLVLSSDVLLAESPNLAPTSRDKGLKKAWNSKHDDGVEHFECCSNGIIASRCGLVLLA